MCTGHFVCLLTLPCRHDSSVIAPLQTNLRVQVTLAKGIRLPAVQITSNIDTVTSEGQQELVQQGLQQAALASEVHQAQNLQRVGSGTGDILRTNFLVLVDTVVENDGSLLVAEELEMLHNFKVDRMLH